eukprot:TRINITY_DN24051_c0_g1_i2.p1 TRINITY_DN24051_c0_g1~~TRINITY_DN24051_c0_g1_i2.p1  ORF type:complete len:435 (+),score=47.47 TRINITY_DN24051_c0_g1_i2:44-1306(+)
MLQAGVPVDFVRAWRTFMDSTVRWFKHGDALGSPFLTSTGLPQGCALSVVALLFWTETWHGYNADVCPTIQDVSFADNIEGWGSSRKKVADFVRKTTCFVDAWDMELKRAACWTWAVRPMDRRWLKLNVPWPVKLHSRELGAHVSYCKKKVAVTSNARIAASKLMLQKVGRLPLQPHQRAVFVRAIHRKALHSGSVTPLDGQVPAYRTAAVRALRKLGDCGRARRSPALTLAVVGGRGTDPVEALSWMRVLDARRFLAKFPGEGERFQRLVEHYNERKWAPLGPVALLGRSLRELGLSISDELVVRCVNGGLHLVNAPLQRLSLQIRLSYQKSLWREVTSARKGFIGAEPIDLDLSHKALTSIAGADRGILQIVMQDGVATNVQLARWGMLDNDKCECGKPDTLLHRWFDCDLVPLECLG